MLTLTDHMIVYFPHQRIHRRRHRAVQFADDIAEVHVFEPHSIARHELWYTEWENHRMRLDAETRTSIIRLASVREQRQKSSVSVSFTLNQLISLADELDRVKV